MSDKFRRIKNVLWVILFANILVALLKIIIGTKIKSSSMTADGFHSLTDGTSNIIGIVGIGLALKPKDFFDDGAKLIEFSGKLCFFLTSFHYICSRYSFRNNSILKYWSFFSRKLFVSTTDNSASGKSFMSAQRMFPSTEFFLP